jgi:DNA polymerase-3 subunit epsilon
MICQITRRGHMFPLSKIASIEASPEDYRLLTRVPFTQNEYTSKVINEMIGDEIDLVLLDTETTGLESKSCKIIELGLVKLRYSPSMNHISEIVYAKSFFEDPLEPISLQITEICGITDDMVAGHKFDDNEIHDLFAGDPIVIAHNAGFDRSFFDKRFPTLNELRWACSIVDIDWQSFGVKSKSLEYLLMSRGFFYSAHRAQVDCLATAFLLHINPEALSQIIHASRTKSFAVRAIGAPFEQKDTLKKRGYKWEPNMAIQKHWYIDVSEEMLDAEIDYLSELYSWSETSVVIDMKTARERYVGL